MSDAEARYYISGVCCSTEEGVLRKCLNSSLGTDHFSYNSLTSELRVSGEVAEERVLSEVHRAGFRARAVRNVLPEEALWTRHSDKVSTGTAALLAVAGLVVESAGTNTAAAHGLLFAAILIGGWRIFTKALGAVRTRALDMNVLMTIAVVGALSIGRWGEGAAVIVLFSVALMLETHSTSRTRRAVRSLLALSPQECTVMRDGKEYSVPAADVSPDETMVIRPGERIPLDGLVSEGTSTVNQAPITGESEPVEKRAGATVYAGSLNGVGLLRVRVTKRYQDTMLAGIVHLIEESQRQRAPIQSFVDRFARIYTPVVLIMALLVAIVPPLVSLGSFSVWFYRSLVLLVIACPCALVLSTPVTLVSALTNAARHGILVKGGRYLEVLSKTRTVVFDKTGTLTEGMLRVTDLLPLNSLSSDQVLKVVAALEHYSEHHLAAAVLTAAVHRGIDYRHLTVEHFEALPGLGVSATISGERYFLGNERLCRERVGSTSEVESAVRRLAQEGKTTIILGREKEPVAILGFQDTARGQSKESLFALRETGVRTLVMLSGDQESVTARVAEDLGIDRIASGLLPAQKAEAIRELRRSNGPVAMVGDGINDAPALAAADTGIGMGVSGVDATLETADVILMSDNLAKLPHLFALSRTALRAVRQNVALALGIKLVFLMLSLLGVSTLWMAVLADDGAALAVIANGLRLLSHKENL